MDEKFKKENKIYIKDKEMENDLNETQIKAMIEIKKYMDNRYNKQNKIIIEKNMISFVEEEN